MGQLVVGFGYIFDSRLKIAVDIKWINWSDTMGANLPKWSANVNGSSPWNCDWDDQMVYAIGLEYALNETFRIRAGYNYGKNPLPEGQACEAMAFPAIQEQHYTLGPIQAKVVSILYDAATTGSPWRHGQQVLAEAGSRCTRISDLFKTQAEWRKLIQSDKRGKYRLNIKFS